MYVKITNDAVDQFPYTVGNLRHDNPNTSFPKRLTDETLAAWGVYPVTVESRSEYNQKTQNINAEIQPSLSDGVWTLGWAVTNKTSEEITEYNDGVANMNRQSRDELLEQTDWWAVADRTMTAEQTSYRKLLRDITTHSNWPHLEDADWPTKP